jgi:TolB-like protein
VLPFENLSTNQENAFFTDGVQDEIRADLAKVADLKVISRTSVMQYKNTASRNLPEIAQTLKVTHILEGSVQRGSNRVRVSVQLIDVRTDTHLWAEHYDRPLDDVFAIQSEIANTIAEQLKAKISPSEKAATRASKRSSPHSRRRMPSKKETFSHARASALAASHKELYSVRNAAIGLMRVARRAGSHVARIAAAASTSGASVKATGSSAPT